MEADTLTRYFEFLDELRADGSVNMFGARPYLAEAFSLDKRESSKAHGLWMATFSEEAPVIRAKKALANA